jgi:hypothetical protein
VQLGGFERAMGRLIRVSQTDGTSITYSPALDETMTGPSERLSSVKGGASSSSTNSLVVRSSVEWIALKGLVGSGEADLC